MSERRGLDVYKFKSKSQVKFRGRREVTEVAGGTFSRWVLSRYISL